MRRITLFDVTVSAFTLSSIRGGQGHRLILHVLSHHQDIFSPHASIACLPKAPGFLVPFFVRYREILRQGRGGHGGER